MPFPKLSIKPVVSWAHKQQPRWQPNQQQQQHQLGQQLHQKEHYSRIPSIPGTNEKFKKMCKAKGIQVHYKGTNTLRTLLGNPRTKTSKQ